MHRQTVIVAQIFRRFLIFRDTDGGTCPGDSGGPLLLRIEDIDGNIDSFGNSHWEQVGVLHGSLGKCSNIRHPAIYTRYELKETCKIFNYSKLD